jgi:Amt family ammonium transporter
MSALVMGAVAGTMCSFTCSWLKPKCGYDDSLDAFGVHGLGGTLGALLTGVFATRAVNDVGNTHNLLGLLEGGNVLVAQIIATIITWIFAAVASVIILKIIDATMGLRVTQEDEMQGLDVSQHGEEGYIFT